MTPFKELREVDAALRRQGFELRRPLLGTLGATWRYAEIFFRRASNVGFADAEIVDGPQSQIFRALA